MMMMNSDQNQLPNSIEQARELLSPYMDDEVTAAERELVEAALAKSPDLQAEIKSLRQTVALVNDMSRAPAPRPFTLTEADVRLPGSKKESSFWPWFKPFMGAAAALAAVFVVGILFILNSGSTKDAAQIALAPSLPKAAQQTKMEADTAAEPAAEMQKAAAPAEQPAAEMKNGIVVESVTEVEKEGEAAFSVAETALPPEPAAAPLLESEAEVPAAVERMTEGGGASKDAAAEAEPLDAAADVVAEAAMEEAPVAMDAVSGAAKSVDEMTAASAEPDDAQEERAAEAFVATQIVEAAAPAEEAVSTPATTTLFAPMVAQEEVVGGEDVSAPTPASVSPEIPLDAPTRQTQLGAMALAAGLAVAGLVLALMVAIFLIIRKKK